MFELLIVLATGLCALVAGFLLAFAVVVMPGIQVLDDRAFLRAFQVMDGVIQGHQPAFMVVWLGSALSLLAAALWSLWQLAGVDQQLLIGAAAVYVLGVQLPTVAINVPLNNRLQVLALDALTAAELHEARQRFEARWNQWNRRRTVLAIATAAVLMIVLLRL